MALDDPRRAPVIPRRHPEKRKAHRAKNYGTDADAGAEDHHVADNRRRSHRDQQEHAERAHHDRRRLGHRGSERVSADERVRYGEQQNVDGGAAEQIVDAELRIAGERRRDGVGQLRERRDAAEQQHSHEHASEPGLPRNGVEIARETRARNPHHRGRGQKDQRVDPERVVLSVRERHARRGAQAPRSSSSRPLAPFARYNVSTPATINVYPRAMNGCTAAAVTPK